jgi:hypothetical protein
LVMSHDQHWFGLVWTSPREADTGVMRLWSMVAG